MNKIWYIQTTEYYFAIKKNEVLLKHTIIWMNLEDTVSERNQS